MATLDDILSGELLDLRDLATYSPDDGEENERYQRIRLSFFEDTGYHLEEVADNEPTAIRDNYFEEYAQELAEDIGAIGTGAGWPLHCIDWKQAARELQMDYSQFDIEGITYWVRSY